MSLYKVDLSIKYVNTQWLYTPNSNTKIAEDTLCGKHQVLVKYFYILHVSLNADLDTNIVASNPRDIFQNIQFCDHHRFPC